MVSAFSVSAVPLYYSRILRFLHMYARCTVCCVCVAMLREQLVLNVTIRSVQVMLTLKNKK